MAENTRIKSRIGDLFAVPLSEDRIGFGQILAGERTVYYMAAFGLSAHLADPLDTAAVTRSEIALLGNFLDGSIKRGRWKVLGNCASNVPFIPIPAFKVKIGDQYFVESWDMKRRRPATESEKTMLDFRTDYSPAALEEALKAYFGIVGEPSWYERVSFDHLRRRSGLVI